MGSKKENDSVVNPILAWLLECGGGGYKVYGNQLQRGGEPDIDGQYYSERLGRWIHLKIECKYGEGTPDPRQDFRLEVYKRRGYLAVAVWSVKDLIDAIDLYETEEANKENDKLRVWLTQLRKASKQADDGLISDTALANRVHEFFNRIDHP